MDDIEEPDHRARLSALQDAFEQQLSAADPSAPVPGCGDWRVRELAEHLGSVHLWAAGRVRGEKQTPPITPADLTESEALVWRYAACAETLRSAFEEVPAEHRCRTFEGEGPASFWHRRQAHETLIHLWDLGQAVGMQLPTVSTETWADCVDEVVQVMHPRQLRLGRAEPPTQGFALHAGDTDRRWAILGQTGTAESALVTGPAQELALLLWGRRSLRGLQVSGDDSAVESALADSLTP
ncbi:maleylpyruvate isomerase family mycothiol-dependent enzyme [Nesterenkonia sp. Act20]|uniref:maleylpyruvate isomerase family mycothiol-dependent enzyme n=1 Tax=Nesterenkonia sp. Act20 TaxID=1483432 RepID=UPI001C47E48C|nr:maleylpyruvate isomerase family mycothiol-dependent enzyme [Nesterenkonia sp. Act20]